MHHNPTTATSGAVVAPPPRAALPRKRSWLWWWKMWEFFLRCWIVIRRFFGLGRRRGVGPTSDTFHKILCIGDGTVEGWGDVWRLWRHDLGYPARLQELIDESETVRQNWLVLNCGHYGATSDDWLPDATHKPQHGSRWVKRTLWKDAMDDPAVKDAEVVLISLGAMDNLYGANRMSASHTVDNIITICHALKKMGKLVFVSSIPPGREEDRGNKRRNLERNLLLWAFLEEQEKKITSTDQEPTGVIYAGPGWKGRHGNNMYASDMIHFNSQGYTMRAMDWGNLIVQPLLRIEWRCWNKLIRKDQQPSTNTLRHRR